MEDNSGNSTGLISKTLDWTLHPSFAGVDPLDLAVFAFVLWLIGMLWAKVIRQTLEAV